MIQRNKSFSLIFSHDSFTWFTCLTGIKHGQLLTQVQKTMKSSTVALSCLLLASAAVAAPISAASDKPKSLFKNPFKGIAKTVKGLMMPGEVKSTAAAVAPVLRHEPAVQEAPKNRRKRLFNVTNDLLVEGNEYDIQGYLMKGKIREGRLTDEDWCLFFPWIKTLVALRERLDENLIEPVIGYLEAAFSAIQEEQAFLRMEMHDLTSDDPKYFEMKLSGLKHDMFQHQQDLEDIQTCISRLKPVALTQ